MILTEQELFEYIDCPVKYDIIFNRKLAKPIKTNVSVPQALAAIANGFFATLMDGDIIGTNALKRQWDVYCRNHYDTMDNKKVMEGMSKIVKFYLWAERERIMIADINAPYAFSIKIDHGKLLEYHGSTGAIAITKKHKYEILIPDFSDKIPDQNRVDVKLKHGLDALAFFKQTGENIGIHIHNIVHDKDIFSYRNQDDYKRLTNTLKSVAAGIQSKCIYPRENPLCVNCHLSGLCRGWIGV